MNYSHLYKLLKQAQDDKIEIKEVGRHQYSATSRSNQGWLHAVNTELRTCSCSAYTLRRIPCAHLALALFEDDMEFWRYCNFWRSFEFRDRQARLIRGELTHSEKLKLAKLRKVVLGRLSERVAA